MNKKALSILLAGATAASVVVASAASASAVYEDFQLEGATYGVIGDFNSWGGDVALTDEDGDGLYTATVSVPAEGSSYKVRANGGWDYSWGATNADGVTANSQDNCKFDESVYGKDVTVYFDTRTGKSGVDTWYVGTEEPAAPTPSESSQESSQESSEESSTPEVPAGKYAEAYKKASEQLGEENLSKYYFFDNSESKWAKVGAYWWTPAENATWPGQEAIQIEGTDVWAIEYNAETTKIIFNNLVSDDEYTVDNPKIQTSDVKVDATANAGNIYIPDVSSADAKEDGAAVTYKEGNWVVFDASGEPSVVPEPSEEPSSPAASTPADNSKQPTTPSNDGKDGKKGVETGDSATPIALAAVFAAAALTAVVLTKKKVSSK